MPLTLGVQKEASGQRSSSLYEFSETRTYWPSPTLCILDEEGAAVSG